MLATHSHLTPTPSAVAGAARLRRDAIERALTHADETLDAIARELRLHVSAYSRLPEEEMDNELRGSVARAAAQMLQGRNEQPDSRSLKELLLAVADRRAAQSVPLDALLHGWDIGARICWETLLAELLEATDENPDAAFRALTSLSIDVIAGAAELSGTLVDSYMRAERERADTTQRVRREIFDQLLAGASGEDADLRERIAAGGFALGDAHAVAVLAIEGGDATGTVARRALDAIRRRLAAGGVLPTASAVQAMVQLRHDTLLTILPARRDQEEPALGATIESAIESVDVPDRCHLTIGLGRIERGLLGIAVSYRQALRAVEAGQATGASTRVISYAEMLPTLLLLGDPELAQDSWRTTVEALFEHDEQNGTQLVATLSAFLEERGVLAATAKRLFVHRHTLAPRLERIEELTGRSLRDRDDLLMLELGLRARAFAHGERESAHPAPARTGQA